MKALLQTLIQSILILCALILARPFLKRRLSARALYALWLLPALRMTLPFELPSVFNIPGAANPHVRAVQQAMSAPLSNPRLAWSAPPAVNEAGMTQAPGGAQGLSLAQALTLIYFAGLAIMILWTLLDNFRFSRRVRQGMVRLNHPGPLPVYVAPHLASPCLWGIIRPKILLTPACAQDPNLSRMAIRHETAHYKRGDAVWGLWRSALLCAYWFNPLVWAAAKLSRDDGERACDELAVRRMSPKGRQAYGMALIQLAHGGGTLLFTGSGMGGSKRALKERIQLIARPRRQNKAVTALILCCAGLMTLVFCTSAVQPTAAPGPYESQTGSDESPASVGIIGGADGPTAIYVAPGDDPLSLIEDLAPWTEFEDIPQDGLDATLSKLGGVADSYHFMGRVSQDGKLAYILGVLTDEKSPLQGLSASVEENDSGMEITYLISDPEYAGADEVEPVYTLTDLGVINYDIDNPQLLFIEPKQYASSMDVVFEQLLSGNSEYLLDARDRGVSPFCPPAPYIAVSRHQDGALLTEYIPLSQQELDLAYSASSTFRSPADIGYNAIRLVDSEPQEDVEDQPVPELIYQMAVEKCGFTVAGPEDIGSIAQATLSVPPYGAVQTLEDSESLSELQALLSRAQPMYGLGGCPYDGVLALEMADGRTLTLHKATDSCGCIVFGSMGGYELSDEDNARFWALFDQVASALEIQ